MAAVIRVYKKRRILELYYSEKLIASFPIALGSEPLGPKMCQGDGKTPEGLYSVCTRNVKSKYCLFLGLTYPNPTDAKQGLEQGLVSETEYHALLEAAARGQRPCWDTALGGAIGIHGGGTLTDWTAGCIALTDTDMISLWPQTPLGTAVHIFP